MAEYAVAVSRRWLWAEFTLLFIVAPLVMAVALPPRMMFRALFAFTVVGLVLLHLTGGFDWRVLVRGWGRIDWRRVLALIAVVVLTGWAILAVTRPQAAFSLIRSRPEFMLLIWGLYPILSALPQELIFRVLFFHRYARLMPGRRAAVALNAGVFSFAHLMYWSPIVAVLTFGGGVIFARAYLREGFPSAWVMHAVAGNALFAVGMGVYFYSGAVVRPF